MCVFVFACLVLCLALPALATDTTFTMNWPGSVCLEVQNKCGRYEKGQKLVLIDKDMGTTASQDPDKELTRVPLNGDGEVVVSDIKQFSADACKREHLRVLCGISSDKQCWKSKECPQNKVSAVSRGLMFSHTIVSWMLCIGHFCFPKNLLPRLSPFLPVVIYWYGDLWAGILSNIFAVSYYTRGMAFSVKFVLMSLAIAQVIEFFMYDLWLWILSKCKWQKTFLGFSLLFGWGYGNYSLAYAYLPSMVAILGHHVIVLGLLNFFLDFLKHIAVFNIKRLLCGQGLSIYEPVKTELTHVLPEELAPLELLAK